MSERDDPFSNDVTQGLAREAAGGDPELLEQLFLRVGPALTAWACVRVPPSARHQIDPEDLVQEVWLRALAVFPRNFDPDAASFRGWLFRLAYNVLRELYRKLGSKLGTRVPGVMLADNADAIPDSITALSRKFARLEAIRSLAERVRGWDDPRDRTLFILRGLEGLPHERIAERLGLSAASTRKRWERVRARLDEAELVGDLLISD